MSYSRLNIFLLFSISSCLNVILARHGRVEGGTPASPGQFPYVVSFQIRIPDFDGHYCTAAVLNSQWIVTAARCLWPLRQDQIYILAGTTVDGNGGTTYEIITTVEHPQHNLTTAWNDIALVKIDGEFQFSDTVSAISIGDVPPNASTTLLAWSNLPGELEYVPVTTLSPDDCSELAQGSFYDALFPRGPDQICAFSENGGVGGCYFDWGGPLIYNNTLVGLVSYPLDDSCTHKYPDVYTKTAGYMDWIQQTIAEN